MAAQGGVDLGSLNFRLLEDKSVGGCPPIKGRLNERAPTPAPASSKRQSRSVLAGNKDAIKRATGRGRRSELAQFGFPFWRDLWRKSLAHRIRVAEEFDAHLISAQVHSYLAI